MEKIYRKVALKDPRIIKWAETTIAALRYLEITGIHFPQDWDYVKQLGLQFNVPYCRKTNCGYADRVADKIQKVIIGVDGIERAIMRLECITETQEKK